MFHGITAKSLPPCRHGLSFEGIKKEDFTTIVVHEVIVCLNTVLRIRLIVQIDDQMSIFGNQVSILVDDFFDTLDIFIRSAENLFIKDIGIRKDSLVNKFGISSESSTKEPIKPFRCGRNIAPPLDDHVASIQLACAALWVCVSGQSNDNTTLTYSSYFTVSGSTVMLSESLWLNAVNRLASS